MERRDTNLNLLSTDSANVATNYSDFVLQCFVQLRGREQECLELVELCDQLKRKWKESSEHCILAEEKAQRLEREKEDLSAAYDLLNERFHDSAAKVATLLSQKDDLKKQLGEYQKRIQSIRSLMENELKGSAAFGKLMNLSKLDEKKVTRDSRATRSNDFGLDFDKSANDEEEIDIVHLREGRMYERRSRSVSVDPEHNKTKGHVVKRSRKLPDNIQEVEEEEYQHTSTPPKRSRDAEESITTVTTITMDARGRSATKASVEVHRGKRSMSESKIMESMNTPLSHKSYKMGGSSSDLRTPLTGMGSSWTKGRAIFDCDHSLEAVKGSLMKSCVVCNRSVAMQPVYKCKDCSLYLHNNCRARAPLPCLPFASSKNLTPQKKNKFPRLADLCPVTPPLVPATLIRLIYEIETSRLETEGLYRVPGNGALVEKLLSNMSGSIIPQLTHEYTEVLTAAVKKFLVNLKEPLIPNSSYSEFIQASRDQSNGSLMKAIAELPEPNKDTLAFICLHLQKVAKCSQINKMTIPGLAICMGVIIVRGGRKDELNTLERNGMNPESEKQRYVMQRLLEFPEDYWERYLNARMFIIENKTPRHFTTPRNADQSLLGPVSETPPLNFTPTVRSAKRRNLNVKLY
ncbi:unnamed protein product [Bursaphelenchus okinawaensis]|uniref:Rho-GAP domain-containing protein n=1 Tax=Bursaphelenchus okinawaensis TaxID=465554 RepID=A0A811KU82_9BILA|nr:unnamed protein product [Bursaphelenchus okinawaensis]CAG9111797.1 unnamed protein product [Bursaphelenchus okinawaensis]